MIYSDEEKITYSYNLGGQLEKFHGYKSYGYDYVSKIGYDKFEQRGCKNRLFSPHQDKSSLTVGCGC